MSPVDLHQNPSLHRTIHGQPRTSTMSPFPCHTCSPPSSSSSSVPPTFAPGRLDLTLHRRRGSGASDSSSSSPPHTFTVSAVSSCLSNPLPVGATTVASADISPRSNLANAVCSCSSFATDASSELQHVSVIRNTPGAASSSVSSTLSISLRSASISPKVDSACKGHRCPRSCSSNENNGQEGFSGAQTTIESSFQANTARSPTVTSIPSKPQRLRSLDLLRGISIVLMVLVNTQGADPFKHLAHSAWFGYTLADWVFPNFIFMVGVALALVFNPKRLLALSDQSNNHDIYNSNNRLFRHGPTWIQRNKKRLKASGKILKRSIVLFGLGIVLALLELIGRPRNELWPRIPGVLQRIAFCYLVLALTVLWTDANQNPPPTLTRSALESWKLPFVCTALWLVLTFSVQSTAMEEITGCLYPASAYSPAGLFLSGHAPSRGQLSPPFCTAQAFLDTVLFKQDRDTNYPIVDAEGTLGSLMAIVTGWFGWVLGRVLLLQQQQSARFIRGKDTRELKRHQDQSFTAECLDVNRNDIGIADSFSDQTRVLRACSFHSYAGTTMGVTQIRADAKKSNTDWGSESPRGNDMGQSILEHPQNMTRTKEECNEDDTYDRSRLTMLAHMTEWFMAGVCVTLAGVILDWGLPVCKSLWTPSFTLVSAGFSILALCALLYIFDLPTSKSSSKTAISPSVSMMTTGPPGWRASLRRHSRTFWQLMVKFWETLGRSCTHLLICYGRNSTLIFMLSEAVKTILDRIPVHTDLDWIQSVWSFIFFKSFIRFMPAPWASLVFSLVYILFFAPLMWYLDSKAIYLRV